METLFNYNNLSTNGVLAQDKKFTIEEDLYCLSQFETSKPYTGKGNVCNSGEFDGYRAAPLLK